MVGTRQIAKIMYGSEIVWENIKFFANLSLTPFTATEYDEESTENFDYSPDEVKGVATTTENTFEGEYEFTNISEAAVADTLVTYSPIQDGDTLAIMKDDDSVHELVAAGVTGTGPYTMDTSAVTQGEVPSRAFTIGAKAEFNVTNGYQEAEVLTHSYGRVLDKADPFQDGSMIDAWYFEDNADGINGDDGVITGGVYFEDGPNSKVARFVNTNEYITVTTPNSTCKAIAFTTNAPIVDAIAKFALSSTASDTSKHGVSVSGYPAVAGTVMYGRKFTGGAYGRSYILDVFNNTNEKHIVVNVTGTGTGDIYVDGIKYATTHLGAMNTSNMDYNRIGCGGDGNSQMGTSYLGPVMKFNRPLTDDEALALSDSSKGLTPDVPSALLTDTRTYGDVTDSPASITIDSKVTLKSVGDKMTKLVGSVVN